MNKAELAAAVAAKTGLSESDSLKALEAATEAIGESLEKNQKNQFDTVKKILKIIIEQ